MASPSSSFFLDYTKSALEKDLDPVTWSRHLSSAFAMERVPLPSPELSETLASLVCSYTYRNSPLYWKYLDQALSSRHASPLLVLAILSSSVVPTRHQEPLAYRIYLELQRHYAFSLATQIKAPTFKKITVLVDDFLQLSKTFGIQASEPGVVVVEFVFYLVWQLIDAILYDEGLQDMIPENKIKWQTRPQHMDIDGAYGFDDKTTDYKASLRGSNCVTAIELSAHFLQHKLFSGILGLARENMSCEWDTFTKCLHLIVEKSPAFRNSAASQESFLCLISDNLTLNSHNFKGPNYMISTGLLTSPSVHKQRVNSSIWIPIDLYLEDCIDGSVAATSAIESLTGLVKSLQAINRSTWHDAFLGLWMASLRLVQRERDPQEGPVPRLDSRLCMLLSITTLAVRNIIEEEENNSTALFEQMKQKEISVMVNRRRDLISCLQALGDFESLLVPPASVISAANQAAAKAIMFVSGYRGIDGYMDSTHDEQTSNIVGNLRHLIVEACISRNILDTSAYFWTGYISGQINQASYNLVGQVPGWSSLLKGASLSPTLVNALALAPASNLAELEKITEIALNGANDEKISAATILCGASLIRGWNIQEHTVRFVVNLLSLPVKTNHSSSDAHLISHDPVLNVVLTGISSVDCVQVFSYHGLVPELAGALMAICEVYGSCVPSSTGEEVSAHAVFSNAFILLLRLWKFNHPPLEYCLMGDGAPVGSQLTPEYLLLLRNSQVQSSDATSNINSFSNSSSSQPIFVDSFPKLKTWYRQHQACLASTLSGLKHGTPVHQNVDSLLTMMFWKMNRGGDQSLNNSTTGNGSLSNSSSVGSEDCTPRPRLPAWDIMEAVPFVVDAALTACSHGRLSPRELATGLKDLADFLPASLATIVSYFSAEVTRGVWKPAFMNGTDWPSPAANLSIVEEQIKKIVGDTGVNVPSLAAGGSAPATLPLPLAAFVSLTITYKLDKASERFLNLAGPALESLAASCPWPSMPIVAALWTQKVKRWSDFLIFSASRTVFHHNNDTVVLQLLRSCFTATISKGGVGSLLGHGFGSHFCGGLSPVAPGILYLRIYRCINDTIHLTEDIISLLLNTIKDIAEEAKKNDRYMHISIASCMELVKVASSLGATFVWLSGGSRLVQALIHEILPSWLLSVHREFSKEEEEENGGVVSTLLGYGLAYFLVFCGMFTWGIGSAACVSSKRRRSKVIEAHMEFLANAFDGKVSLGCNRVLWKAYVTGLLGLMVECAPSWVTEVDVEVIKRLGKGLRQVNQNELALALFRKAGVRAMGMTAEAIILAYERGE